MPRLLDDMRASGKLIMPWFVEPSKQHIWEAHAQRMSDILKAPDLPVIHIDNVAEYYFTASDQEHWDLTRDFPNLAPPFATAWFEHKMPKIIHSKECGDTHVDKYAPRGRVGILLYSAERKDVRGENIPENMRWLLNFELFIDYGNGATTGPHGMIHMAVDAEGKLIDIPFMQTFCAPEESEVMKNFITFTHPALLAISFLHCKNVRILDEPVIKPLAKKFHKRTGNWPVRSKILEITPLKEILRHEGRSHEVGLAKAMHICRGHFKDYREGKGLFGKYHQLVWQPQLVRGGGGKKGEKPPAREMDIKL